MKERNIKFLDRFRQACAVAILAGTALLGVNFLIHTDLSPQVDPNFFFASDDYVFLESQFIEKRFPSHISLIVLSVQGDIHSYSYIELIRDMSNELSQLPAVNLVNSVTHGPANTGDAMRSPLWMRLLISYDQLSTHILVFMDNDAGSSTVVEIEEVVNKYLPMVNTIRISGVPYVIQMIQRLLTRDLMTFSVLAVLIFAVMIRAMFGSFRIMAGTLAACFNACVLTLLISRHIGIRIGLITANIVTIIFVLTLSHIVYITRNWQEACFNVKGDDNIKIILTGLTHTFVASFWSMATTLLGFISLLFVAAKPLRELGVLGAIGTCAAIVMAYGLYPFLLPDHYEMKSRRKARASLIKRKLLQYAAWSAAALIIFTGVLSLGLNRLNTDPSLFSFFQDGSSLRAGLEYIDENGGSSFLNVVIRDVKGGLLTSAGNIRRLKDLQDDLETIHSVGSIMSLPVIVAESRRTGFGSIIPIKWLIRILKWPIFGSISNQFITPDEVSTHLLIRMKESGRQRERADIIDEISNKISEHGFFVEQKGGLFLLQGQLAGMVSQSVLTGLVLLIIIFFFVGVVLSGSIRIGLAMLLSVAAVPVCIFGLLGLLGIPVDIITASTANIAAAMGIDQMIHIVARYQRQKDSAKPRIWFHTIRFMWRPVFFAMAIISAGFSIFLFSSFPPTRYFGLSIVFGNIISALASVFLFPFIIKLLFIRNPFIS
jgi:uncharacterized protein